MIGVLVAMLSALGSGAAVLKLAEPVALRKLIATTGAAAVGGASRLEPAPPRAGTTVDAVTRTADSREILVPRPPLRSRQSANVGRSAIPAIEESDLTFTKGYARRRAAMETAGIAPLPPPKAEVAQKRAVTWPNHRRNWHTRERNRDVDRHERPFKGTFGGKSYRASGGR
jgi:hypothetical protein